MEKPPTFKVKNGPYSITPGPAAYILSNLIDALDSLNGFTKYPGDNSKSKSPQWTDPYFDFIRKSIQMKISTMNNDYFPSMTATNFLF